MKNSLKIHSPELLEQVWEIFSAADSVSVCVCVTGAGVGDLLSSRHRVCVCVFMVKFCFYVVMFQNSNPTERQTAEHTPNRSDLINGTENEEKREERKDKQNKRKTSEEPNGKKQSRKKRKREEREQNGQNVEEKCKKRQKRGKEEASHGKDRSLTPSLTLCTVLTSCLL